MRFTNSVVLALATTAVSAHYLPDMTPRQLDYDPCNPATAPANASVSLGDWFACQVNSFFPYPANGDWSAAYDSAFSSTNLLASFNSTKYSFDGFKTFYAGVNASIGAGFESFEHGFSSVLGVPNANGDAGGFVYLAGWEGGKMMVTGAEVWATDAVFAVVEDSGNGERKITEFRESSNMPNSGELPESQDWTCALP